MNQKLRTARNGSMLLLALLGIVCLSLGLLFTSVNVTFAEDGAAALPEEDPNGQSLWLAHFEIDGEDGITEVVESLLDGDEVTFVDDGTVTQGLATEKNTYVGYRGRDITIKINPLYEIDGTPISELYDLNDNIYYFEGTQINSNSGVGVIDSQVSMTTYAWLTPLAGGDAVAVQKEWKIVPLSNNVRERLGDKELLDDSYINNYVFGDVSNCSELRPEHGNTVIYSFINSENEEVVNRFAMVYNAAGTTIQYYNVLEDNGQLVVSADSISKPEGSQTYLNYVLQTLASGKYTMRVTVPAYQGQDGVTHTHWWETDSAEYDDNAIYYATSDYDVNFEVSTRSIVDNDNLANGFTFTLSQGAVSYNGSENNTPSVVITLNGITLVENQDYQLASSQKDVGLADLTVIGLGSIDGELVYESAFEIIPATNTWQTLPSIMQWEFGAFNREVNLISGYPVLLDNDNDLRFAVAFDAFGEQLVAGLDEIYLENGLVSEAVASLLAKLPVRQYYLVASVVGGANYEAIEPHTVPFAVAKGHDSWKVLPSVENWIKGKYDAEANPVVGEATFGKATIVITDANGNVVFDTRRAIDNLANLGVGTYIMTASVAETNDYYGLNETKIIHVLPNGLPWWAVLIIVVGSLGVVAIVFAILHEKGILQMLTGKVILAMRTKANVDATIAAVRANRKAREAEASIAEAKAREEAEEKAKQNKK